jgi:hypothetical protein
MEEILNNTRERSGMHKNFRRTSRKEENPCETKMKLGGKYMIDILKKNWVENIGWIHLG